MEHREGFRSLASVPTSPAQSSPSRLPTPGSSGRFSILHPPVASLPRGSGFFRSTVAFTPSPCLLAKDRRTHTSATPCAPVGGRGWMHPVVCCKRQKGASANQSSGKHFQWGSCKRHTYPEATCFHVGRYLETFLAVIFLADLPGPKLCSC